MMDVKDPSVYHMCVFFQELRCNCAFIVCPARRAAACFLRSKKKSSKHQKSTKDTVTVYNWARKLLLFMIGRSLVFLLIAMLNAS